MISLPQIPSHVKNAAFYSKNHELNNEGCLCPLCQKVSHAQNMVQHIFLVTDRQSQQYDPYHHKEVYLDLIDELMQWQKFGRKLRYCLPQICVFFFGNPAHLISKGKDNQPIKIVRSKSKLNVFQLQHFFLDGYLQHSPDTHNRKKEKHEWKERVRQVTLLAGKYRNNTTALLTLEQLSNMFKSKFKYMREDLMYLQTAVGGQHCKQFMLKINVELIRQQLPHIFDRAKLEASIMTGEVKVTDPEYYSERAQSDYERLLAQQNKKHHLIYLTLKILFISSKTKENTITEAVFKWACVKGSDFLWDVRVIKSCKSATFWQSSGMKALEFKLQKTMSLIEFGDKKKNALVNKEKLSPKAQEMSRWLQKSTQIEWDEMKIIRERLEKLQDQKKKLLESQREGAGSKLFRMRNMPKKTTPNASFNQSFNFNPQN